jgi:histidinol-phosphatase
MSENWRWFLPFANELADRARGETLSAAQAELVEDKGAEAYDPVTAADRAAEKAISEMIAARYPDHGIAGEEFGASPGSSRYGWSIDPIDGTRQLVCGLPMWTTLIALSIDGVPRVGVASQPALGRRWWAARGLGAWTNTPDGSPARLAVSSVDSIAEASASFQSIRQWDEVGQVDALLRLSRAVWRDRGYGDTWPYMLLAEGRLEFVAEFGVKEYDIAALVPIITEAGGRFTSFDGSDSLSERSSLATNGRLHAAFLDLLHAPAPTESAR